MYDLPPPTAAAGCSAMMWTLLTATRLLPRFEGDLHAVIAYGVAFAAD
eukprot:CAMPEP_0170193388 /NCGR_PEP_ID=MMETSP0040_2-20121228/56764_1 /TAXON_ID=641309 /ORGANISM="Lotharella oceanica, Strain CCMP622" /LENGTH=47 /DNA_ID= /DNA_START= /DNA_END= /DNA_ORIENTATION=